MNHGVADMGAGRCEVGGMRTQGLELMVFICFSRWWHARGCAGGGMHGAVPVVACVGLCRWCYAWGRAGGGMRGVVPTVPGRLCVAGGRGLQGPLASCEVAMRGRGRGCHYASQS